MTQAAVSPPPSADIVYGILSAAWRHRLLIVLPCLVLPVAGFVMGKLAPRTYETHMSVLVQGADGKGNPDVGDSSVSSDLKDQMDTLKALLASRPLLLTVAQATHLISPDAGRERQDAVAGGLAQDLNVTLTGDNLLVFSYKARHPYGIDKILLRAEQMFVSYYVEPAREESAQSVSFLKDQLRKAQIALDAAEATLSDFRGSHLQELPDQRTGMIGRLTQQRDALKEHEVELAGARGELAGITERLIQTDPVIGKIEQDIISQTSELSLLRGKYTENHSAVIAAERTLSRLEEERASRLKVGKAAEGLSADSLWNMVAALPGKSGDTPATPLLVSQVEVLQKAQAKVRQLEAETESLRGSVASIEHTLSSSGEIEKVLREKQREFDSRSEEVAQIRARFEKARVNDDFARYQAPQRFKIINPPYEPLGPVKSPTVMFTIAGLLAGLLMGSGLATVIEMLDPSVRRTRDAERIFGLPVLTRISASFQADA
jgi:polysaccharide chain length determinant protein (PEP-CTERM system associated)